MNVHPAPAGSQLADIQGNILKGHGRTYTALVFFRFGQREEAAVRNRRLLHDAATRENTAITLVSAAGQQRQTKGWFGKAKTEKPFRSLGLTTYGLRACGYTAANLGITSSLGTDQFWDGATPELLGDGEPWDEGFAMEPDGVVMLAHNVDTERDQMATDAEKLLRAEYGVGAVVVEKGFRWKPLKDRGDETTYEHFGFADGFARIRLVARPDSPLSHLVNSAGGFIKQNVAPFELPLERVMIEEAGPFQGGSFLVVHKLEQNVRAFLRAEAVLQARLGELPKDIRPDHAGALFIGRERNGTPLVEGGTVREHRFHFGDDPNGSRCPFSAHIRKMNPRQNKFQGDPHRQSGRIEQKNAQFVRRGVLYGDEKKARLAWPNPELAPEGNVGLLFMGYMTQTGAQFLKMLFNWGPEPDFPQADSGADVLLGGGGEPWDWRQHPTLVEPKPLKLGHFVKSKGAAFFIVPPVRWLRTVE